MVVSGMGYRINQDELHRYIYPVHNCCPKRDSTGFRVVHPGIGIIMRKGPKSERSYVPEHVSRLQFIWNISHTAMHDAPLIDICLICDRGSDVSALRTCALCLQTSHDLCIEACGLRAGLASDSEMLGDRFSALNLCSHCVTAFMG